MIVASGDSITETWISGTEKLLSDGGDAFTSILHVRHPAEPSGVESDARSLLDGLLARRGKQDTETVANTIFPHRMASRRTADELYQRYLTRTFPRIRALKGNGRGTYFHRLIQHQGLGSGKQIVINNPLADVIRKMAAALAGQRTLRSAYELGVYRPSLDANIQMGFPCLSHVSLKLDPELRLLHLTALYRNQYYIERAYGNLLGLTRLQAFVARELGLNAGELACHATHAHLDTGKRVTRVLLDQMRTAIDNAGSSLPIGPSTVGC
jgi:hypothetical protein